MDILISYLQQGLSAIIPFIILLGLLIFVHELGHFLVAKYYGVRVEVFSLGFGKKIMQFRHGDTLYCISLIPLGGYVKMFGDEPNADIPEEDKKVSFLHKPVGQRIAVVLAGPLMNLFFAVLLFMIIALSGEDVTAPILGDVSEKSQAYQFGFRSDDQILKIKDKNIKTWREAFNFIIENPNRSLSFQVQRQEEKVEINATPTLRPNPNLLSFSDSIGSIEGFSPFSHSSLIGISDPSSPAGDAGLLTGDQIVEIAGRPIKFWRHLAPYFTEAFQGGSSVTVKVERQLKEGESQTETLTKTISLVTVAPVSENSVLNLLGIQSSQLFLSKVLEDSPAHKAGILKGDHLRKINGTALNGWEDVIKIVSSYKSTNPPLTIEVMRKGALETITVAPKMTTHMTAQGQEKERFTVGIMPYIQQNQTAKVNIKTTNPLTALYEGTARSWLVTKMVFISYIRLFQNKISPKNIGGVISIGQAASETFKVGFVQFVQMMAIISINLFILNLLPIPILDGGHLVFYTLEALKGAPVSMRKMEIAQQVGLFLLMGLMVFALFNDFSRLFNFSW